MIYDRLRVFVSSRMAELAPERQAIREALDELKIDGWIFEEDAGAQSKSIETAYKQEIDRADLYVGVFWRGYGAYTLDEFDYASAKGKDRLIYEKRSEIDGHRDPELQSFLDKLGVVENGLTPRWFETTEELREGLKQDAARWQADKIRQLRELNVKQAASPRGGTEERDLNILLSKVKRFWIDNVLGTTMKRASLVNLTKETQPSAVSSPWEAVLELPFEGTVAVPTGQDIGDVFEDIGHSILILGQPGSGKSTTLLTLVQHCVKAAEQDANIGIPVVFHLASWGRETSSLLDWFVDELSDKYQVPKSIGRSWLEQQRLMPFLDGLDEVLQEQRDVCVDAINTYVREIGLPGIAVCCRLDEYAALDQKLLLNGAVSLKPLTTAQIDTYISEAGDDLDGLRQSIAVDPILADLACSPLMLNVMCLTYKGVSADQMVAAETRKSRVDHLFTNYIKLMTSKRVAGGGAGQTEGTLTRLSWLAKQMSERNVSLFLTEDLQPDWLPSNGLRAMYLVLVSLIIGLVLGLTLNFYWQTSVTTSGSQANSLGGWLFMLPSWIFAYGVVEWIAADRLVQLRKGVQSAAAKWVIGGVVWILLTSLTQWLFASSDAADETLKLQLYWTGFVLVSTLAVEGRDRHVLQTISVIESLKWSLSNCRNGALIGFVCGAIVGSVIYFPTIEFAKLPDPKWIAPVGVGIFGGALGAVLGGLTPNVLDTKGTINHGIHLSLKTGVLVGLNAVWLVAIIMFFFSVSGLNPEGLKAVMLLALSFLLPAFIALFLWFGGLAVIKHYVLRFVFWISGCLPMRLTEFLDDSVSLGLLQRAGNAHIFIHGLFLEYMSRRSGDNEVNT